MALEKEFIPYEEALEMKELGFDESCVYFYENSEKPVCTGGAFTNTELSPDFPCTAPLWQQAFKWFRERYNFHTWIFPDYAISARIRWNFSIIPVTKRKIGRKKSVGYKNLDKKYQKGMKPIDFIFSSPEEAQLACLRELIKITRNEKDKEPKS